MTKCLCLAENWTTEDIAYFKDEGSVTWAIYRRCPVHPQCEPAASPWWMPGVDLQNATTAADEAAAVLN